MAHLIMLVIFHVNAQLLVKFSIYHTFITSFLKNSFFKMKIFKLITWYPNMVQTMCNDMGQYIFNFHKNEKLFKNILEYICVFEYISTLHLFSQIHSIFPLYKMKWNSFFSIILPRLYSNIICQDIVIFFQNFKVWYIQTCTSLENSTMWHHKRGHHNVLSPFDVKLTLKEISFFIAFRLRMLANIKS